MTTHAILPDVVTAALTGNHLRDRDPDQWARMTDVERAAYMLGRADASAETYATLKAADK